jgi:hypothetical protein
VGRGVGREGGGGRPRARARPRSRVPFPHLATPSTPPTLHRPTPTRVWRIEHQRLKRNPGPPFCVSHGPVRELAGPLRSGRVRAPCKDKLLAQQARPASWTAKRGAACMGRVRAASEMRGTRICRRRPRARPHFVRSPPGPLTRQTFPSPAHPPCPVGGPWTGPPGIRLAPAGPLARGAPARRPNRVLAPALVPPRRRAQTRAPALPRRASEAAVNAAAAAPLAPTPALPPCRPRPPGCRRLLTPSQGVIAQGARRRARPVPPRARRRRRRARAPTRRARA